jgi:hypothetical protein
MIARVSRGVRSDERQGYVSALDGLWSGLSRTLSQLERYAADPEDRLDTDAAIENLSTLQYRLHVAGELAVGIVPPPGSTTEHEELAAALADARDSTAEIVEALDLGGTLEAAALVPEWRGALFRVRLARLRLNLPRPMALTPPNGDSSRFRRDALVATGCALAGTIVFAAGAAMDTWTVWAAGLLVFAAGFFFNRF